MSIQRLSKEFAAIAHQVRLSAESVEYYYEAEVVKHPLSETDLAELRRARRLQMLEVNPAGIEIILRMRRQLVDLQAELEAMTADLAEKQARFEREVQALRRQLSREG